jgi:large subunit ribosomal protein L25
MISLNANIRDIKEDLSKVRDAGFLPGVFYGLGSQNTPVSVSLIDFIKVFRNAGESTAIKLVTPNGEFNVLVHDVQVNPINDEPIHVDFLVIDMNKKVRVNLPLNFEGAAPATKGGVANLVKVLHEVEVEALPNDLPHEIAVDLSPLTEIGSQILVSDIKLPKGVEMISEAEEVVASVTELKEEKEENPVDMSAIAVEKKGKKEESTEE